MRVEKRRSILEIKEDVKIKQEDHDIILEAGDKISILTEKDAFVSVVVSGGDIIEYSKQDLEEMIDPNNRSSFKGADNLPYWIFEAVKYYNVKTFNLNDKQYETVFEFLRNILYNTNGAYINVRSDDRRQNGLEYK